MEWLISSNYKMFDTELAFEEMPYIDWRQSANYEVGDIIYMYVTSPISAIQFKAEVIKINIPHNEMLDDRKYEKQDYELTSASFFSRIKLIKKFDETQRITLEELHEHGMKGNIQGPRKLLDENNNPLEWAEYIHQKEQQVEAESFVLMGKEKEVLMKARVNQGIFRERLIHKYHKCCLCNVDHEQLLIASHIKPWSVAEEHEKLDVENGFLLCPNHDALFDAGYISFDDDGNILISKELSEVNKMFLNIHEGMHMDLSEGNQKYLQYHREYIFKK